MMIEGARAAAMRMTRAWRAGTVLAALVAMTFAAGDAFAGCNVTNKRSEKGTKTAVVEVVNKAKTQSVSLYWIDYQGKRVFYAKVPPGGRVKQQTFRSHPWIITNDKGRCLDGLVAGQGGNQLVYKGDKNDGWQGGGNANKDKNGNTQNDGGEGQDILTGPPETWRSYANKPPKQMRDWCAANAADFAANKPCGCNKPSQATDAQGRRYWQVIMACG